MNEERLMQVILSPHVTNKSHDISEKTTYVVFKVATSSTKLEIKKATEMLFGVKVNAVKTVKVKGKSRLFSRIKGRTKDWKKAYVRLCEGHDINFISPE